MQTTAGRGPLPLFGRAMLSCRCWSSGFEYSIPCSKLTPSGTASPSAFADLIETKMAAAIQMAMNRRVQDNMVDRPARNSWGNDDRCRLLESLAHENRWHAGLPEGTAEPSIWRAAGVSRLVAVHASLQRSLLL